MKHRYMGRKVSPSSTNPISYKVIEKVEYARLHASIDCLPMLNALLNRKTHCTYALWEKEAVVALHRWPYLPKRCEL